VPTSWSPAPRIDRRDRKTAAGREPRLAPSIVEDRSPRRGLYFAGRFGFHMNGRDAAPESAYPMAVADTVETMSRRHAVAAVARSPLMPVPSLSGLGLRLMSP
jgi:hypothetical protein